ncbi:MAG: hypothetical protein ABIR96_06805 [Bdellovibrionota bacterium]
MSASFAAHAQKTATVLPAKIFRVRAVGVVASPITQTLNANGEAQSLMSSLERTLSTKDVAATDANLQALYDGLNQFEAGLGDSLMTVDLQPKAQMNARQTTMAVEYGVNSRLSLGVIIPTVQMQVKTSFNARVNSQAAQVAERTQGVPGLEQGVAQFAANTPTSKTFADGIFTSNGYKTPSDFNYSGLGDIELGAKYQYLNTGNIRGTCLLGFRAPTATHTADRTNLLDRSTGDGQWDLAAECANEFDPIKTLTFGTAARYTVQLPDSRDEVVLHDGQSGLPDLTDASSVQRVHRDLGDMIEGEVSAKVNIDAAWNLTSVLGISYKLEDRYTGPSGYQISALGKDTESAQSRIELAVGYSTIPAFAAKKFPVPMEVKLAYNNILEGFNTTRSAYTRMDLIVYF